MWKTFAAFTLTGVCLSLTLPVLASGQPTPTPLPGGAVAPAEVKGQLLDDPTEIWRPFGVHWYIPVAGQRYYLDFGQAKGLEQRAAALRGTIVVATGRPEVHGRWMIVGVTALKADESVTVRVEGELGYHGNTFSVLGDGTILSTTRWFPWEGYFIEAGGKKYVLDLPAGDRAAERLRGKAVVASGVLEFRQVGHPGREYEMPFIHVTALKAAGEGLVERAYEGPSAEYWQEEDAVFALKTGNHWPLVEHVRGLLGDDLKEPGQSLRVEGRELVVRTTPGNHAKIKRFLDLLARIPGPPR
jgi:hypothetical protein